MSGHKLNIKWEEFEHHANALCHRIKETNEYKLGEYKGLLCITRGGLVPTSILARELNIRLIDTMCIVSYDDDDKQTEANIIKKSSIDGDGKGWLIVDDLVDTGKTFDIIRKIYPNAHYVSIYAKPKGRGKSDIFMIEVPQETWIVLPWE